MGSGCLRGHTRSRPTQGGAHPPAASTLRGAGVHAQVVEHPGDGGPNRGGGLHLGAGPAGVGPALFAAARVGLCVGGRRAGAVKGRLSEHLSRAMSALGPGCGVVVDEDFSFLGRVPESPKEEEEEEGPFFARFSDKTSLT